MDVGQGGVALSKGAESGNGRDIEADKEGDPRLCLELLPR